LREEHFRLLSEFAAQLSDRVVPRISAVARKCGVPVSTAHKLLTDYPRVTINAIPCYPALGLVPTFVLARVERRDWVERAREMLYVKYVAKAYPGRRGVVMLVPPPDLVEECVEYLGEAGEVEEGYVPERALLPKPRFELLDRLGELEDLAEVPEAELERREEGSVPFDLLDLRILAKLEKRYCYPSDIYSGLGVCRKTVEMRMKKRVRHLIEGFGVRLWVEDVAAAPLSLLFVEGGSPARVASLPLPVAIFEGGERWVAALKLPRGLRLPLHRYLSREAADVREYVLDPSFFTHFTVPYNAWEGAWARRVVGPTEERLLTCRAGARLEDREQ